jgi:hypothetical protein
MIVSIHQPDYLPWLGFFDKVARCDVFVLLDNVKFSKNYFHNRNKIRTPDGWIWLTVPVLTKGKSEQKINEVKINNITEKKWAQKHWRSIEQNYRKAPFFNKYADFFEELYAKKWDSLAELNKTIVEYLVKMFGLDTKLYDVASLDNIKGSSTELLVSICTALKADVYLSGEFGKDYLDEKIFTAHGIKVVYQRFLHPEYKQMFEPFIPNMSAIDLLFNYGEGSKRILLGEN